MNTFGLGGFFADGVVECQRAVQNATCDLPAIRHLAERRRVDRGRHFRSDSFDRGENGDLGSFQAKRDRKIDGVLANINFVFQVSGRY